MNKTYKIFTYSFYDVLRSRWTLLYFAFFFVCTYSLLFFSANLHKAIASLMNIVILIIPLISTVFAVMHYYNARDFTELLLAQPVKRKSIFIGQLLGLSVSLSLGFVGGTLFPFLAYGLTVSGDVWNFVSLIASGLLLTFIFTGMSYVIAVFNENRIKGFGLAILSWLYMAVIYDGLMLLFFVSFSDYPLEKPTILLVLLNPIDLARVFILLKLDVSALMGYTGAVFNDFFGTGMGMFFSGLSMLIWVIMPLLLLLRKVNRKDF